MENKVGRSLPIGGVGLGELSRPRQPVDVEHIPFHPHKACKYVIDNYGSQYHCLNCPLDQCIMDIAEARHEKVNNRPVNGKNELAISLLKRGALLREVALQTGIPIGTLGRLKLKLGLRKFSRSVPKQKDSMV